MSADAELTPSSLDRFRPAMAQRKPEGANRLQYSTVCRPVNPEAPYKTRSYLRSLGMALQCEMRRLNRGRGRVAGMQGHRDERCTSKDHIDAHQQTDRPGGCTGQSGINHSRQDQIHHAADQHHAPPSGKLALVLKRKHDRYDAFEDEK